MDWFEAVFDDETTKNTLDSGKIPTIHKLKKCCLARWSDRLLISGLGCSIVGREYIQNLMVQWNPFIVSN
jgi:hypothetical protein